MILVALLWNGLAGLSLDVFTKMTPPPGRVGGLLNSIVGSLIMTGIGLALGAPIGMLAGTYLAEYGRTYEARLGRALHQRHSAERALDRHRPVHLRDLGGAGGHFSALAGAVALAVLGAPIMVRTTEDMLNLVPNTLREAGLGARHAAFACHPARRLPRRHGRPGHRRPARNCPHDRRDRAAASSPRSATRSSAPILGGRCRRCRS